MSDHRHILSSFLRTDLHRLEASLEACRWSTQVAERLTTHLRFALQLQAIYLEEVHPRDGALRRAVEEVAPKSIEEACFLLAERTEALIAAIQNTSDSHLDCLVFDPYERGFSVLGHLYEFCRANAMLVEWVKHLPLAHQPIVGSLGSLIQEVELE